MPPATRSGIKTSSDGSSYIPSSTRADGSTRKEIRVRPGYRPPEDVDTYKSRNAEAWRGRGSGGVPGADSSVNGVDTADAQSKNAKRREAARKKKSAEAETDSGNADDLAQATQTLDLDPSTDGPNAAQASTETNQADQPDAEEAESQKKIRNVLKKLRAVRDLKEKRASGEKLSHDQLVKIGKEDELLRDLKKLDYQGPEVDGEPMSQPEPS